MIRKEVAELVDLGSLPPSSSGEAAIRTHEQALGRISPPVTTDEARVLLHCFGPDDCFGLAWSLVHLIESAPNAPLENEPEADANEWLRLLWSRSQRSS
jgi:hypothetical protein